MVNYSMELQIKDEYTRTHILSKTEEEMATNFQGLAITQSSPTLVHIGIYSYGDTNTLPNKSHVKKRASSHIHLTTKQLDKLIPALVALRKEIDEGPE